MNSFEGFLQQRVLRYFAFVGCVILATFLVATIWEGIEVGWGKWIYDYQTLITGITAVGAAWLTINQMKLSDQRQASQAEAAMALSIREDFLRVERLHTAMMPVLEKRFDDWNTYNGMSLSKKADFVKFLVRQHEQLPDFWHALKRTLADSHFDDAQALFNGRTSAVLETLRSKISRLEKPCDALTDFFLGALDNDGMDEFFRSAPFDWFWDDWRKDIVSINRDIRTLIFELQQLEEKYSRIGQKSELLNSLSKR